MRHVAAIRGSRFEAQKSMPAGNATVTWPLLGPIQRHIPLPPVSIFSLLSWGDCGELTLCQLAGFATGRIDMAIAPTSHTRGERTTDSWITPRWLLDRLGEFDLDPCACDPQPWATAKRMLTVHDNGLLHSWEGFVWCNPPYGRAASVWLNRLALHGSGIALVFARTETRMFFQDVWPLASSLLFLKGRLTFCYPDGTEPRGGANSGGPSVLIGYGDEAVDRLRACSDLGAFVDLRLQRTGEL